jgi:prephenate dehydratase
MKKQKVAIQGIKGSFHDEAARYFFQDPPEYYACDTFREVVEHIASNPECSAAVMAIENSIAGSILDNYRLLQHKNVLINGEIYLKIRQHLLTLPGVSIEDIREVHSHPMALRQCEKYLSQFPGWRWVESCDTAWSAQAISLQGATHIAVIAGKQAAEEYGLQILQPDIHTHKMNYTRFLLLKREEDSRIAHSVNKASIFFHLDHEPGSLFKVLEVIARHGINLSKIQSSPMPEQQWNYYFHVDLEFDHKPQLDLLLPELENKVESLNILGIYPKGTTV